MFAIRVPCSALGGTLLSVALFLGLAQLVYVPLDIGQRIFADPVIFTPQRVDTPVQPTRDPQIQRKPPIPQPGAPRIGIGGDGSGVEFVRYRPPNVDPVGRGGGLSFSGVDGDVIPIVRPSPDYPPRALYSGIEGWVRVQFSVTSIGTVRDAVVVDSEPGTLFDEAALKAIARWRYSPRVDNGQALERVGLQTIIRFELEN